MFDVRTERLKQLESDLKTFKDRAYPFATRNTLNQAAFDAQGSARRNIKRNMTTRNNFTAKSVRVEKTRTLNVDRQMSVVGSTQEYMEKQEFGGVERKKGKHGVPIPTSVASGEGVGVRPRRRLVRAKNRLPAIKINKFKPKGRFKNKGQEIFVRAIMAARKGATYIFLDMGRRKGIFLIQNVGGKGEREDFRMLTVWDLSNKVINVPRNAWLMPAVKRTGQRIPSIHIKSLEFQLKRLGILGG